MKGNAKQHYSQNLKSGHNPNFYQADNEYIVKYSYNILYNNENATEMTITQKC